MPSRMGGSISSLLSGLFWTKKEIRILILGLVSSRLQDYDIDLGTMLTPARTMLAKPPCYIGSRYGVLHGERARVVTSTILY